jgi:hypothetical protein
MTEPAQTLRAVRGLDAALRDAVTESRLAYEFNTNSYTFAAMNACLAAALALENLRTALESESAAPAIPHSRRLLIAGRPRRRAGFTAP